MFFIKNPYFFWGLLTIIIPVIFYFKQRIKPVEMNFSSLMFIRDINKKLKQKIRFYNLLRLINRILFLTFLTLIFLRPEIIIKKINSKGSFNPVNNIEIIPNYLIAGLPMEINVFFNKISVSHKVIIKFDDKELINVDIPSGLSNYVFKIIPDIKGKHNLNIIVDNVKYDYYLNVKSRINALLIGDNIALDEFFKSLKKILVLNKSSYENLRHLEISGYDILVLYDIGLIEHDTYEIIKKFLKGGKSIFSFITSGYLLDYLNKMYHSYIDEYGGIFPGQLLDTFEVSNPLILKYSSVFKRGYIEKITLKNSYNMKIDNKSAILVEDKSKRPIIVKKVFGKGNFVLFLPPICKNNKDFYGRNVSYPFLTEILLKNVNFGDSIINASKIQNEKSTHFKKRDFTNYFLMLTIICLLIELMFYKPNISKKVK